MGMSDSIGPSAIRQSPCSSEIADGDYSFCLHPFPSVVRDQRVIQFVVRMF
jgi:hypothetical protein